LYNLRKKSYVDSKKGWYSTRTFWQNSGKRKQCTWIPPFDLCWSTFDEKTIWHWDEATPIRFTLKWDNMEKRRSEEDKLEHGRTEAKYFVSVHGDLEIVDNP